MLYFQFYISNNLKIIFRITDIIYNEKLDTIMRKIVVGHLIAKQIVTALLGDAFFWSLNSFTTFYGAYILDKVIFYISTIDLLYIF